MPWQHHQPSRPPPAYALKSFSSGSWPHENEVAEVWTWKCGLQLAGRLIPTRDIYDNMFHVHKTASPGAHGVKNVLNGAKRFEGCI